MASIYASDYLENKVLNYIDAGTALGAAPTNIYLALWNGDPTDTGTGGTEVDIDSGGTRPELIDIQNGNFRIENNGVITVGTADGSYTVDHFAVFDSATVGAGNMLWYGPTDVTYNIVLNDDVSIADAAVYGEINASGRDLGQSMRNWVFEWIGGTNNFPAGPSAWYVSIWNGDPESGGTEVTTDIRLAGRVQVTSWTKTGDTLSNDNEVDFGNAANTTSYSYIAIYKDVSTAADSLLFKKNLGVSSVNKDTQLKIPIGNLTFKYD